MHHWRIYLVWKCSFICSTAYTLIPWHSSSHALRAHWATWRACQGTCHISLSIHLESVSCGFEELVNTHHQFFFLIAPPITLSSSTPSALWLHKKWDIGILLMMETQKSLRTMDFYFYFYWLFSNISNISKKGWAKLNFIPITIIKQCIFNDKDCKIVTTFCYDFPLV